MQNSKFLIKYNTLQMGRINPSDYSWQITQEYSNLERTNALLQAKILMSLLFLSMKPSVFRADLTI